MATPPLPAPGTRIANRYVVETAVDPRTGRCRATDTLWDRTVSLRLLPATLPEELRARVARDAEAAAAVEHPHLVGVHGWDADPEQGWEVVATEPAEGQTLAGLVAQRGTPPAPLAMRIVQEAAAGMAAAHEAGVAHGTLHPGRLMLVRNAESRRMEVRVAGLAVPPEAVKRGEVPAYAAYAAPERLRRAAPSAAADVWSLGVIAYELFAGLPEGWGTTLGALARGETAEIPAPRAARPGISEALSAAVERALAVDPADRWPDAAAFAAALADAAPAERAQRAPAAAPKPAAAASPPPSPAPAAPESAAAAASPPPSSPVPSSAAAGATASPSAAVKEDAPASPAAPGASSDVAATPRADAEPPAPPAKRDRGKVDDLSEALLYVPPGAPTRAVERAAPPKAAAPSPAPTPASPPAVETAAASTSARAAAPSRPLPEPTPASLPVVEAAAASPSPEPAASEPSPPVQPPVRPDETTTRLDEVTTRSEPVAASAAAPEAPAPSDVTETVEPEAAKPAPPPPPPAPFLDASPARPAPPPNPLFAHADEPAGERTRPALAAPHRPAARRPAPPSALASRPTRAPRIAAPRPKRGFPVVAVSAVVLLLAGGGAAWSGGLIDPVLSAGVPGAATMRLAQAGEPAPEEDGGAESAGEPSPAGGEDVPAAAESPSADPAAGAAPPVDRREDDAPSATEDGSASDPEPRRETPPAEPEPREEPVASARPERSAPPERPAPAAAPPEQPALPSLVTPAALPADEVAEPAVEAAAPPPAVVRRPDPNRVYGVEELDRAPELTNGAAVMRAIQRSYNSAASGLGTVHMNVTFVVEADGRVDPESIFVPQTSLASIVQRGLSRARFRPATLDGRAVRARVTLPLTWVADEEE